MRRAACLVLFLAATALLAPAVRAGVTVVDLGAGDSIQDAIDAAAEGDTILVTGTLGAPTQTAVINGKSLTLLGDVPIFGPSFDLLRVAIRNLAAGQTVTLQNLDVAGTGGIGLIVKNNAGAVRFSNVHADGGAGQVPTVGGQEGFPGSPGATIENCDDVVFIRSSVTGGRGGNVASGLATASTVGGTGMVVTNSTVAMFSSAAVGGDGGEVDIIFPPLGSDGGIGATADGSRLALFNSSIRGGPGGENDFGGSVKVSGGLGFLQTGAGAVTTLRDAGFVGGIGEGFSPDGEDSDIADGVVLTYPSPIGRLELDGDSPLREGEDIVLHGRDYTIGTEVWLLVSLTTGNLELPGREGVLVPGVPLLSDLLFLGTSPAITFNNVFDLGPVPDLPAGFDEVHLFLQGVEIPAGGTATLSEPEVLTVLDAAL